MILIIRAEFAMNSTFDVVNWSVLGISHSTAVKGGYNNSYSYIQNM